MDTEGEEEDDDDDDFNRAMNAYHHDEDAQILDENSSSNHVGSTKQQLNNKKRHLITQESISDTDFFNQRFDGPGLKNLNKQESIIEEEESGYGTTEPKAILSRPSIVREVCIVKKIN